VALWPALVPYPAGDLREHMLQHLLIGMVAPILLVLAAPITLLLRSLPAWHARRVARLIRSGPVHVLANPMVALALNIGGMAALYFTPLYLTMQHSPLLHLLVHVHFLFAGCLFAWVIAGPDPAPNRPSVPARLVLLGVAIFIHATLAQLLYAGLFVSVPVPPEQRQGGAELMYYGGDLAELGLAFALVSSWRPRREVVRGVPATPEALNASE
jgi:putative membrane protein